MLENKYLREITSILAEQLNQAQSELRHLRQRHPFWGKVKGIFANKHVQTHADVGYTG
ncbi:MAG: hypothetical protein VX432_08455 [Candidatus Poribacteria bacterium]|nr:hypothetical protein [Candidatus Poribacteria bacterium]